MRRELILEIGVEEIPAADLGSMLPELKKRGARMLGELRLEFGEVRTLGTPRRLTLVATDVAAQQQDLDEEVVGPPASIGFDSDGAPTKAALGFAKKNGVEASELSASEVPGKKGKYVVARRKQKGQAAEKILADALSALIGQLPWAKSMRWGERVETFIRPLNWIVATLGKTVIEVHFAGVRAQAETYGHRFLSPEAISFDGSFSDYQSKLRAAHVVLSAEDRATLIRAELSRIEVEANLKVKPDDELIAEVANLVEYPVGICGSFDASFLELPDSVIISAMRSHQRYFATLDASSALSNRFVTLAGTVTRDPDLVRRGNERVLAARLEDARFFYNEDRKKTLREHGQGLDKVVFQKKLGTLGAKTQRLKACSEDIARRLGLPEEDVATTAMLSKSDLTSHLVGEFPDLQGYLGARYAEIEGYPGTVCQGISEHYAPRGAYDALPQGDCGAVVGLADRMDTLVGCFAVGMAPTGSADPYALRRSALAVVRILDDKRWDLALGTLIECAAKQLESDSIQVKAEVQRDVSDFLRTRFRSYLCDVVKLPADCVDAALAVGHEYPSDARLRASALSELRNRNDFDALASAFKRVANILKGKGDFKDPQVSKFVVQDEGVLWAAFSEAKGQVSSCIKEKNYPGALEILSSLRGPVDNFFESVLVMDKDAEVRDNRLAILGQINAVFLQIADFRQLAV